MYLKENEFAEGDGSTRVQRGTEGRTWDEQTVSRRERRAVRPTIPLAETGVGNAASAGNVTSGGHDHDR